MDAESIYNIEVTGIDGKRYSLSEYQGKVMLIVNTASQCGFTEQYAGLQTLYDRFADKGLVVLGFPCNQFGEQEPGSDAEIQTFCSTRFNLNFPLHQKIEVNGKDAHPLYQYLKQSAPGILGSEAIKWNFTKFLVNKQGKVVQRYGSTTKPEAIATDIEALII
jgi:glutathione peroxidase